jgi:hypothetical protein
MAMQGFPILVGSQQEEDVGAILPVCRIEEPGHQTDAI